MLGFTPQEQKIVAFLMFSLVIGAGVQLYKRLAGHDGREPDAAFVTAFRQRGAEINAGRIDLAPVTASTPMADTGLRQRQGAKGIATADTVAGRSLRVNINSATAKELETLPRIGPTLARRIVEYRNKHGMFSQVEDLIKIKGIGRSTLRELQPRITLE